MALHFHRALNSTNFHFIAGDLCGRLYSNSAVLSSSLRVFASSECKTKLQLVFRDFSSILRIPTVDLRSLALKSTALSSSNGLSKHLFCSWKRINEEHLPPTSDCVASTSFRLFTILLVPTPHRRCHLQNVFVSSFVSSGARVGEKSIQNR